MTQAVHENNGTNDREARRRKSERARGRERETDAKRGEEDGGGRDRKSAINGRSFEEKVS